MKLNSFFLGLLCGSFGIAMLAIAQSSLQRMIPYGTATAAEFSQSQCYALARASDHIQMLNEVVASKGLALTRLNKIIISNGWKANEAKRFIWELSTMWGRRIDPRSVESNCLERGGKYEEGERIEYESKRS